MKKKVKRGKGRFELRIVGEGVADPKSLVANPGNWRSHGPEQREALREVLEKIGWVQRVIVNRRTGRLVDGHMRVEEAAEAGETAVPVAYIDVTEKEERLLIATLDPIAAAAGADLSKLKAALEGITPESAGLQSIIASLEELVGVAGGVDGGAKDDEVLLDQSVQLQPGKEYVVIVCDDEAEWEEIRRVLALRMVRRGGYKKGSPFDDVGVERVITAKRFANAFKRGKGR